MTEIERDHFDTVRRHLLDATRRSAHRSRRRRRHATVAMTVAASLVLVTGIAAAASDRVATIIVSIAPGTVLDVFEGEPEITDPPTPESEEMLRHTEDRMRGVDPADPDAGRDYEINPRVLLRETIDGTDVEIVAYERPAGSPSHVGPRKRPETCWTVHTGGSGSRTGGEVTCSPEFTPALPINYGAGWDLSCAGNVITISGIAANSVRAVRLETANGIEEATMGDGAFWWRSDTAPVRIYADLVDGSTVTRPYRFGEPPETAVGCD